MKQDYADDVVFANTGVSFDAPAAAWRLRG